MDNRHKVFINEGLQQQYDDLGIVKLPLFTTDEIDELRSVFIKFHPQFNDTMQQAYYVSMFGADPAYRQQLFDTYYPILKAKLDSIFKEYKILAVVAQVKGTSQNSVVNIHQDLTVVDESEYFACTFWIPLSESTLQNGAIYAMHRSQQVFRNFRVHTLNFQFGQVKDFILNNATAYPVNKGEVLAFDPACIHYSPPNVMQQPRLSLAVSIVSAAAPVQIGYWQNDSGAHDIEVYNVPDNFWYLYKDFSVDRTERPSFGSYSHCLQGEAVLEYDRGYFVDTYNALKP